VGGGGVRGAAVVSRVPGGGGGVRGAAVVSRVPGGGRRLRLRGAVAVVSPLEPRLAAHPGRRATPLARRPDLSEVAR
ncbi:hypothetical protein ACWEVP_00650, partial [Amycolatopsis sp. NPDC003865]